MILTNCNCGEKVECGCGTLSFDTYNASATSVLEVGNLVADGACTLDEYVIDWYRDGQHALVTGKGLDPDIQAFHPMQGSSAVPVIGGTWVPVVRYVVVSGVQLFLEPKPCRNWCEIETNLPTITVARLNCASSNITGNYQYRISYASTDPNSLPSRLVAWDLPPDLSAKYFAVQFRGYTIADQVDIYFNDETNLLVSWIVGQAGVGYKFNTMPYEMPLADTSFHKFAIQIPEYSSGDFLLIKVTPSVKSGIPQTDWILDMKCLGDVFDCDSFFPENFLDIREYDLSDWSFVDDSANCRRSFRIKMVNPMTDWTYASHPQYEMWRYSNVNRISHSTSQTYFSDGYARVQLGYNKSATTQYYTKNYYWYNTPTYGNVNLTKTGNVFVFTFADSRDYQLMLDNYNASLLSAWWTNREPTDDTDPKFYRWWYMLWRSRPENCGDTSFPLRVLYIHQTSTIVFDDSAGYTLTITAAAVTNNYSSEPCNTLVSSINSYIYGANQMISGANFNEDTLCFEYAPFGLAYGWTGAIANPVVETEGGFSVYSSGKTYPCNLEPDYLCTTDATAHWYHRIFLFRLKITLSKDPVTGDFPKDESGNYIRDPLGNFILYDCVGTGACDLKTSRIKILELVDGVQVYPVP